MFVHFAKRPLKRFAALVALSIVPVVAAELPSITFQNNSGDDAVVRLAGPTSGFITVATSASRTVEVAGGTYRIYVRYGSPGTYYYTRGNSFTVYQGSDGVDQITITLHKVVGGNYGTSPSNEAEFNGGR